MSKTDFVRNKEGIWINSKVFTEEGDAFLKTGYYTAAPLGTEEYNQYWDEQWRRCVEGYKVGGVRITGEHYFYLNFCQIQITDDKGKEGKKNKGRKIHYFPSFWDGDYEYFHLVDIAANGCTEEELKELNLSIKPTSLAGGKHVLVGKARRKGFSYKNAAKVAREYTFFKRSLSLICAFSNEFAEVPMKMVRDYCNFLNEHTAFSKRRIVDKKDHIKAGWKETVEGTPIEKGYLSEIMTLTFKDNPDAARGKDATLILMEEMGKWVGAKSAYSAIRPCVEDGAFVTGQIIAFGCVCAGTKVWTHDGRQINIEDLKQEDGIVGYGGKGASLEPIVWMKPPAKKPCYRIETEKGNFIECSNDHPLLIGKNKTIPQKGAAKGRKQVTFEKAENLRVGQQLMGIRQIPIFGNKTMWNPRLIGLLIGDGYYGARCIELSIEGEEVYNWIRENYKISIKKQFMTKTGSIYRSVNIHQIVPQLKEIGLYGQTWANKHLPPNINECNQWSISELIGGYIDADGSVYYNEKKNCLRVCLTSKYKHLLEEVKILLYKLNIGCNIVKENRKAGYAPGTIYRLYIGKVKDIIEFKKHIKLLSKQKQQRIDDFITNHKARYVYNNCKFYLNPDNNKGTFYTKENQGQLDNLESFYIKSIQYIGEKDVYNLNAGITHTYVTNQFISGNTGGDMEGGTIDFHEMFYSPEAYNLLAFNNIWDENAQENKCSFFFPAQQNLIGFVDEQGNSLKKEALEWIEEDRLQISSTAKDKTTLTKRITEYATNPMEAFSLTSGNIFPGPELMKMLGLVESTKNAEIIGIPGEMVFNPMSGKPEFQANLSLQPADFPVKNTDDQGCIVMWEQPPKEAAPTFTFLAGLDPYDQDKASNSVSLGSLIIMRKAHPKYGMQDKIVCEYTARPGKAEEFYETCRRLLIAYNAICLYENEKKGVYAHFKTHNSLQYLAYTPTYLKALRNSTVNRVYGLHMTPGIKKEGEIMVRDWLTTMVQGEEGKMNLHFIYSPAILKELIKYRAEGNFDRVISLLMLCILRQEYYNVILEEKKVEKEDPFWSRKLVR